MNNNEVLVKEIDLTQACIKRMAQNSFIVKGWTISLVTVVLAFLPEKVNITLLCLLGIIATLCFWYLDAFFLRCERLYRWKYEWIIASRQTNNSYFFDLDPYNKSMWLPDKNGKKRSIPSVARMMFTKTLMPIYIPLIVLPVSYFIYDIASNYSSMVMRR